MDTIVLLISATIIEGMCASKIARKFKSSEPVWKFFIPVYNVFIYGKFSLISQRYLYALVTIQGLDLVGVFIKNAHPLIPSIQPTISTVSFLLWAIMAARLAALLGQGFWGYLLATVLSAVAGNFAVVALLYVFVPSFDGLIDTIPLWAELLALIIMSLPFISLAFDKNAQQQSK